MNVPEHISLLLYALGGAFLVVGLTGGINSIFGLVVTLVISNMIIRTIFIFLGILCIVGGVLTQTPPVRRKYKPFVLTLLVIIGFILTGVLWISNPTPLGGQEVTTLDGRKVNVEKLKSYIRNNNFKKADSETQSLLFTIANLPNRKTRFEKGDSSKIGCSAYRDIDNIWTDNTNSKFGLSVQKDIYEDVQEWDVFIKTVGWADQDGKQLQNRTQLKYDIAQAPNGHLPGTLFWITQDSNFYAGLCRKS